MIDKEGGRIWRLNLINKVIENKSLLANNHT
jgi:hypothetical protein